MPSLPAEMLDFIASGVAHQVGACTGDGTPLICRALAAAEEPDGRLCVAISGESGHELLAAIRANARVSLVLVAPQSFRALHLKGRDAVVAHGGAAIRPWVEQRRVAFQRQIEAYGFAEGFTHAWYPADDADLMAIRFTPFGAWSQTPGPGAGTAVELAR